eukprot:scaffold77016_cov60-Phaeocystis_antarctica.AAC.4
MRRGWVTLLVAETNTTGYFGVSLTKPGNPKPYKARVKRDGNTVHLGLFATAEEAALCVARSPEGKEAAERAAAAVAAAAPLTSEKVRQQAQAEGLTRTSLLTSEEVRQQAQAEGLTLLKAENKAGYLGVYLDKPGQLKPYQAQVRWQANEPGPLHHRRGGGAVRRAIAGGAGGGGKCGVGGQSGHAPSGAVRRNP